MAGKKVYTLGLTKVEMAEYPTTGANAGGMASDNDLEQLGYTYKDTMQLTTEDPETTEHYVEEVDDPVVAIETAGKQEIEFSIPNPSPETCVLLMGGTASASVSGGDNDEWEEPDVMPHKEMSVRLTPKQGYIIEYPRMHIVAKLEGSLNKSDLLMLKVKGTMMKPEKQGVAKRKVRIYTPAS